MSETEINENAVWTDDWEVFTENRRSFAAKATISASGMLHFSEGACQRFHIKEFPALSLAFHASTRRIGIRLLRSDKIEGARSIRTREMGAHVAAKPFLDKHELTPETTMSFNLTLEDPPGILIIDYASGRKRNRKETGKKE
jgi:hypothetical protein